MFRLMTKQAILRKILSAVTSIHTLRSNNSPKKHRGTYLFYFFFFKNKYPEDITTLKFQQQQAI